MEEEGLSMMQNKEKLKLKQEDLLKQREDFKLTLRKQKIDDYFFKKRMHIMANSFEQPNLFEQELTLKNIKLPDDKKIYFKTISKENIEYIKNYLSSADIEKIKNALICVREWTISYELKIGYNENELILLNESGILDLILNNLGNFYKISSEIIFESMWIYYNIYVITYNINLSIQNFLLFNPEFMKKLIDIIEIILPNNKFRCTDEEILNLLALIVQVSNKMCEYIADSKIFNYYTERVQEENIDIVDYDNILLLFNNITKGISHPEKFKCQFYKLFEIYFHSLFLIFKDTIIAALKGIDEILTLKWKDSSIYKKFIDSGIALKLLKKNYDNCLRELKWTLIILIDATGTNDYIIEELFKLNVIDFYEVIIDSYPNEKEIINFSLYGIFNISCGRKKYKERILEMTIFSSKEYIDGLLLNESVNIRKVILKIINSLVLCKEMKIYESLYNLGIFHTLIDIGLDSTDKEIIKYCLGIETCYFNSMNQNNLAKNDQYYYILEMCKSILSKHINLFEEEEFDTLEKFFINIK